MANEPQESPKPDKQTTPLEELREANREAFEQKRAEARDRFVTHKQEAKEAFDAKHGKGLAEKTVIPQMPGGIAAVGMRQPGQPPAAQPGGGQDKPADLQQVMAALNKVQFQNAQILNALRGGARF